jgi:hypothetical protein
VCATGLEHATAHTAHAAHATHATHGRSGGTLLLGSLNNGHLGGTEERGDTRGVSKTGANDLERVEDTGFNHVDVLALGAVEALVELLTKLVHDLADDNATLSTGILDNGTSRAGDGALDNADTELLVKVRGLEVIQGVGGSLDQGGATTGENALLNGSASGIESINETVLFLTDLNLGRATNLDDGNTTRELGKALLKLLLLVVGSGGVGHDTTDLLATCGDLILTALTVENDSVLLGDGNGASGTEHLGGGFVELDVELVGEDGTVGQDGKIAEDGLAVVAESRSLDGDDLELATELVQNADSQSFTVNILGDDDQGAAELLRGLKSGDNVLNGRNLLLGKEDQRLLELDLLRLGVGDEVRRDETTVKLHALGNLKLVLNGLALLDGDDTLLADLLHGAREESTNVGVAVGRDGGDLGNLGAGGNIALVTLEVLNDGLDGRLDTTSQIHGIAAGGNVLDCLGEDGAGKHGGGSGTVTSDLIGLAGNILEETGAEVLKLVLEDNGLGDSDSVCIACQPSIVVQPVCSTLAAHTFCDLGRAVAGLDEDVATLGTESGGDGSGKSVDTVQQTLPGLNTELELLEVAVSKQDATMARQWHAYLVGEALLLQRNRTKLGCRKGTRSKGALHGG